ncbi:MAG TPA: hypothetical protein VN631_17575, partial [Negativicutes bacterium]|nr:hypothetical protein [Negativicutes bacterium]
IMLKRQAKTKAKIIQKGRRENMFGSTILDVFVGLIFIYLILSLICTQINELIAATIKLRAKTLEGAIFSILNNRELVSEIYKNSIVQGSAHSGNAPAYIGVFESNKPSYISSQSIAFAFMDVVQARCPTDRGIDVRSVAGMITCAEQLPDGDLKNAIFAIAQKAQNDVNKFRSDLEDWFDDSMARVTGWYKKRIQVIGFIVALVISVAVNADTIELTNRIYKDTTFRNAVVTSAEGASKKTLQDFSAENSGKMNAEIQMLGWNKPLVSVYDWAAKILGLLLTTIAISLGAPFWFDVLNKFMNARLAGEKPKTAAEIRKGNG